MAEFPTIDRLPEQFAALVVGFRRGVAALARATLPGTLESPQAVPPVLLVRTAAVKTHFSLARQGSQVVLFFLDSDTGPRVVLDAAVSFRIAPAVFVRRPVRMLPEAIAHFVVAPPFLATAPRSLAGDAVAPFLSLARSIGEWVAGDFEQGARIPLDVRAVATRAPLIHEIFHRICEAWSEAYNEAAHAPYDADSPLAALLPEYEIQDYRGSVLLRLSPDGSIAADDSEDPFQLLLTIHIAMENGMPRSRICLGPPDFLVSGSLHDAFLAALDRAFAETAGLLGAGSTEESSELRRFLLSASREALVFRVRREAEQDSDVVVYSGDWNGRPAELVVRAEFAVRTAAPNPVAYLPGTQKIVYSSLPLNKRIPPEPDLAQYCLRLLSLLQNWIGVLR